ncbi:MAG: plastocyanin/azurin family copper-binding protein [Hyphomicrobiales bacterium]
MKILSLLFLVPALATTAYAGGDLSRADPAEIVIEMGQVDAKHMYFKPNHIDLETGKAYKIVFQNTDTIKHEFAAPEFIAKVFTRKVEVLGPDGKMIAEVKGNISEVEVAGGGVTEWFIVPVQTGKNIEMECAIEGHKEAGMVGTVTIN